MSCSKSCHDCSVFPFCIVGRHCLVEILSYFMCFIKMFILDLRAVDWKLARISFHVCN